MNQAKNRIAKNPQINLRPDAKLYRKIETLARSQKKSLNFFLCDLLESAIKNGVNPA